ncbi:MAG: hypothetical protein ACI959_000969 [Limisphaerales bacterium]|jgi:hypothetical protein
MMIVAEKQSAQLENKQHIDDLFGKLREEEVKPSANMWERIDTSLHGPAPVSSNSYFTYSAFRMASAFLIILVLYTGWNAFMVGSTPKQATAHVEQSKASNSMALFPDFVLKSALSKQLIALNQQSSPSDKKIINSASNSYSNSAFTNVSANASANLEDDASAFNSSSINSEESIETLSEIQITLASDYITSELIADPALNSALFAQSNIEQAVEEIPIQNNTISSEQIKESSALDQHLAEMQEELDKQLPYSYHKGGEFYGGINASLNITGLMSEFSDAIKDENLDPGLHIGRSFGLTIGYQIGPRTALEAGLIIDSRQGSVYDSEVLQRQESVEVKKRIDLHYTQLPIAVRIQRVYPNTIGKNPLVFNYVLGVQYGLLRASRFSLEDKYVSPHRNLEQHDFAILLGAEYDLYFSKNLFASLGLRSTISANQTQLTDIDGINRDKRNVVIGLRAGINYVLPSWK